MLGIPDPAAARAALTAGRVVVLAGGLDPDGMSRLAIETFTADADGATTPLTSQEVALPATAVGDSNWLAVLIIAGAGALLALAAAWIAAALAATESRPDLATLTAVGAVPRTRKRIVAAQDGTIAGIGAVVGVLSGYPLGAAFVMYYRYQWDTPDPTWGLAFPWPWLLALLVGLPLLAVTAAWLATRSRLVLTRRVAG